MGLSEPASRTVTTIFPLLSVAEAVMLLGFDNKYKITMALKKSDITIKTIAIFLRFIVKYIRKICFL